VKGLPDGDAKLKNEAAMRRRNPFAGSNTKMIPGRFPVKGKIK
jgi:hypothetical protein